MAPFPKASLDGKCLISLDTEFVDTGSEVILISIGLVRDDGAELYLENARFLEDHGHLVDDWTESHVMSKTFLRNAPGDERVVGRSEMAERVLSFSTEGGRRPSFWAHYASYDWITLCQLYGRMLDVPKEFPFFCMDFRIAQELSGIKIPSQSPDNSHHALIDARWGKRAFAALDIPFCAFDHARDTALPEPVLSHEIFGP